MCNTMIDHVDEESDTDFMKFLPRNLSYVEESYIDNFSVCADFVHASTAQQQLEAKRRYVRVLERMMEEQAREAVTIENEEGFSLQVAVKTESRHDKQALDSSSEEGVFVNMMDDLGSVDSPNGTSHGSEDSYIDSINSPEGNDLEQPCEGHEATLGEEVRMGLTNDTGRLKFAKLKIKIDGRVPDFYSDAPNEKTLLDVAYPESPVYEDNEFNFDKAELRKSSSLKTSKTPPGTPRRKKMVRFADAMGLDLESVRHVLNIEAPPKIPASAMADLKVGLEEDRHDLGSRYLDICFQQPGVEENFLQKVMGNKVALENCIITDLSVTGVVRVANIAFHKAVRIRYTINNWVTFYDIMASYIQNSCDGPTDRFSFTIVAPAGMGPGSRMEFAVSFTANDTTYWDNNDGHNYGIVCYAKTTPTEVDSGWVHFL